MQLNELPGQGQPKAGPLDLLVRRADLPELLEDRLLVFGRDAHAGVGDGDLGHAVVHRDAHVDPTAFWGELQVVGKQVQEDLVHLPLVAPDRAPSSPMPRPTVIPLRLARSRTRIRALSIAAGRSKSVTSSSIRPASTFDRSRMSLIRDNRCCP